MVSKKCKKYKNLNYIEQLLVLISAVAGCVSISAFVSVASIPRGSMMSAIGLKICVITAGIKNYQSIIKKKEKNHIKIVLLAKCKLNSIEFLIFKALIVSNVSYDQFVLIDNVLKELYHMKKKDKNDN